MNQDNSIEMDTLVLRYLQGTASASERNKLEQWIAASDEHLAQFNQMHFIMQHTNSAANLAKDAISVDVDAAWRKVQQSINSKTKVRSLPLFSMRMVGIAAAIMLLLGAGVWMWQGRSAANVTTIQFAASNTPISKQLDDGSSVSLAKNTNLQYSSEFGISNRQVTLTGEAFFDVRHNENLPFTVTTQGLTITDIGTAFNVKSRTDDSIVTVVVAEGIVDLSVPNQKTVRLVKGQTGTFNKNTQELKTDSTKDANALSHKTRQFTFVNSTMAEVASQLNAAYEQEITLSPSNLNNCRISVAFNNEPLDVIVAILCETLQLQSEKTEKGYLLKGKGCSEQ